MIKVKVKKLNDNAVIPNYQTDQAAGMDLVAVEHVSLWPGARALVKTGLAFELPPGVEAQVRSRSGLALKHGVCVLNSPGTVDADYRGEVGVILINHGENWFQVNPGDRIAQVVFATVQTAKLVQVEELSSTERGGGGFGSTSGWAADRVDTGV